MTQENNNPDIGVEILARLWAVKSRIARRMERPGAVPGDDEMNRHMLSCVENTSRIAEDYFVMFGPLPAERQTMTPEECVSARTALRDYGWAAAALEDLMGDISRAGQQDCKDLSPLFARTVKRDYAELKIIADLVNTSWVEAQKAITRCEKANQTLHPINPKL